MASIDRHQYSEEIRKGAAKFVKDLNLFSKSNIVSNQLELEYLKKVDREINSPRRASTNSLMRSSVNGVNGHEPCVELQVMED